MTAQEIKNKYTALYDYMAASRDPKNMKAFGYVMTEMMDYLAANKPDVAEEMVMKLESIRWHNYLTQKEADTIIANMNPKAPWTRDEWRKAMEQNEYALEHHPEYNRCAIYVIMNMLMSDSADTLAKYVEKEKLFHVVHDLAVDKLTDKDGTFNIRGYFSI